MALQSLPYERSLVMHGGATYELHLRWNSGGDYIDLTGWDAWMTYGPTQDDPLGEFTVANGGIELRADGRIIVTIPDDTTSEFTVLDIPKRSGVSQLYYALSLKEPSGKVILFMHGKFLIKHIVPRPK